VPNQELAVESLRRCALFSHVDADGLAAITALLTVRRFRKNEVIFHQGDLGNALYIIAEGAVKIVLSSSEGEEALIATLRPGDFFGELALLDGAPHSATVTALEATETLSLPRPMFQRLLDEDRDVRVALLTGLAAELRRLTGHVEELHFLDLSGRLAMRLVRLARDEHNDSAAEVSLEWPYTQSDLAAMIGGTRQSVNRLLSEFVDEGLLRMEGDRLIIADVDALARRAER
jgi:CRP-like cAMP-binding protein